MAAGIIGVPLGSMLAQRLRSTIDNCDPYICAVGLFASAPMVFLALILARTSGTWCFLLVFVAQVALNLSWSIVADILLVRVPIYLAKASSVTNYQQQQQQQSSTKLLRYSRRLITLAGITI